MKMLQLAALALAGTLALSSQALAHGGGGYRGPGGMVPPGLRGGEPPPPPCVCADVDCSSCSHADLRSGRRLAQSRQETEVLRAWPDLRQVRITATFRARESRAIEAYASLAPGAAFGVTAAAIGQVSSDAGSRPDARSDSQLGARSGMRLVAALRRGDDARRDYLVAQRRRLDPLLLTRRAPGTHDLRAFPVTNSRDTVVVVEGLALADAPCRRTRLYREGDRYLAVVRLGAGPEPRRAALVDRPRGRALYFMSGRAARGQFGPAAREAEEVPGLAALERDVTGTDDRVWVALEEAAPPSPAQPLPPTDPPPPASPSPGAGAPGGPPVQAPGSLPSSTPAPPLTSTPTPTRGNLTARASVSE